MRGELRLYVQKFSNLNKTHANTQTTICTCQELVIKHFNTDTVQSKTEEKNWCE